MGSRLQPISAVVLAGLVSGCALARSPAPDIYDIKAPTEFAGEVGSSPAQLAVTEPTVVGALDSERIVVRSSPTQVSFLAGSQWSDRTPVLFQARLIEAFQNTDRIRSVGRPGGAVVNDAGLVSDLRAFHIDLAANMAVVEVTGRLVAESDGRVIASEHFEARAPVLADDAPGMVAALNAAFAAVAAEMVEWTLARI